MKPSAAAAALLAVVLAAGAAEPAARRSGFDDLGPALQAMQRDDSLNPGMLWVKEGEAQWSVPAGARGLACASCHAPVPGRGPLPGAAARHPAFDAVLGRVVTIADRIDRCRVERMGAAPLAPGGDLQLALEAAIGHASRGMPIAPPDDPQLAAARERGRRIFEQRLGQLDVACAQCHDERAGRRLGGSLIPQAMATGYPVYRLEWQGLGSLERRLRGCLAGVRAEPFAPGSDDLRALEAYLAGRAAGLPVETPAVRP